MPISAIGTAEEPRRLAAPSATLLRGAALHHRRVVRSPGTDLDCRGQSNPPIPGRNGFTLVELLVVLFIIALMSVAVLVALPDPGGALTVEAERFAARVRAAQERSVMDNRPISIRIDQAGYAFEWREGADWQPIGRRPFDARAWQAGTTAEVEAGTDRILFDSTGFSEAQRITLARGRDRVAVEISNGGDVHVRP